MTFRIYGFIWYEPIIDKIVSKHGVSPEEVEECFFNSLYKLFRAEAEKYKLLSQSASGRYLLVIFTSQGQSVRIISARDMTTSERRLYGRK